MVICQCHRVSANDVERLVRAGARSATQVARATRAGTECGSCLPELQALCQRLRDAACDVCVGEALVG